MKKSVLFAGLVVVSLLFSIISCSNSSGGSKGSDDKPANPEEPGNDGDSGSGEDSGNVTQETGYKAGDVALEAIKIGDVTFDKTEEVYVTGPNGATIIGKDPSFIDPNVEAWWKGVFITGRNVTLSPFIMSKYEVTQELYEAVMRNNSYGITAEPFDCKETGDYPLVTGETQKYRPAENMSWYDAVYFCNLLSEKKGLKKAYSIVLNDNTSSDGIDNDGNGYLDDEDLHEKYGPIHNGHIVCASVTLDKNANGYRLPTEAEWEFAARGGDPSKEAWNYIFAGHVSEEGKTDADWKNAGLDTVGWYKYNLITGTTSDEEPSKRTPGNGTHEVGSKGENSCNALGIYDMSGNIHEFCWDYYFDSITTGNVLNPTGTESSGFYRVVRGGSWHYFAKNCTVTARLRQYSPGDSYNYSGFRVVRNAE